MPSQIHIDVANVDISTQQMLFFIITIKERGQAILIINLFPLMRAPPYLLLVILHHFDFSPWHGGGCSLLQLFILNGVHNMD